jgi:hypothetical protein
MLAAIVTAGEQNRFASLGARAAAFTALDILAYAAS